MTTKTMLRPVDVAAELDLSPLEVKRAIAQGKLAATEISGFDPAKSFTKPEWRISQQALTNFLQAVDFAKVRLPAEFLDKHGKLFYENSAMGKLKSHWSELCAEEQQWERAFRTTWAQSKFHSPQRISQVIVNYGTGLPKELAEYSRKPSLGGIGGKIARQNPNMHPSDTSGFTIGESAIFNRARRVLGDVIQSEYGFIGGIGENAITGIDVLYSTPDVYRNIIQKVRTKIGDEQLQTRAIEAELKLDDLAPTTLHFSGFCTFDLRGLLSPADFIKFIGLAF